ncbi:MAG: AraC family transcriptional regulator [Pseudomonadota bacterium]
MSRSPSALFQPFPMRSGMRAQAWRHQPAYRRPRHFHAEPEVNLVVRGSATLGVGAKVFALGSGELVLLQPGQDHELLEASPDLELFVFALRPELAARLGDVSRRAAGSAGQLFPEELARVSEELFAIGSVADATAVESSIVGLFQRIEPRLGRQHVLSRRAALELQADPSVSEAELATRLNATPSDVSRRFHGDIGVRLVEYRARLRLMRFVRLVDAGQSFSEAALNAEFGSYAQCHRIFQRVFRCSPRRYFAGARRELDDKLEPRES